MKMQVELLAPAGSYESLKAAIVAGADAVYVGGMQFGARAYANNLDEETMCRAIDYVHLHGGKLFLTVNTLLKDEELESLSEYLRPYYCQGLDGVIVQDLGVFAHIRREFPGLELHASTQMTLLGAQGAALLKEMGATRIVPARELSLEEIRRMKQEVDIEVETFVHGALCYCYSGQCLFSSMLGGRSGNRGRCAQPCRLPYRVFDETGKRLLSQKGEEYLLSPKDMCTVELIPELIEAGIDSFKIEGRMKRPEYTAGVVSVYRKYIDRYLERGKAGFQVEKADMETLLSLYNRGGFSQSYYLQRNGRSMISLVRPNHFEEKSRQAMEEKRRYEALLSELKRTYVDGEKKEKIQGSLRISKEMPNIFQVTYDGVQVEAEGPSAQEPLKQAMTEEQIRRQMEKTGKTPFVWEKLDIHMDGPVFIPLQSLNELRRKGLEELEKQVCERHHRPEATGDSCLPTEPETIGSRQAVREEADAQTKPLLRVQVEEPCQLEAVLEEPDVDGVYVNAETFFWAGQDPKQTAERCHRAGKECFLALPDIFRMEEREIYTQWYPNLLEAGFDGLLLKNLEELQFLKEMGYTGKIIPDANLYTYNIEARQVWKGFGADFVTLPYELNERELRTRGCREDELIVYGYQPLMVTANCLAKTLKRCKKQPGYVYLEDRYQKKFPVRRCCLSCHNVIYNSAPLYLLDCTRELRRLQPASVRLHFTLEREEEIRRILKEAVQVFKKGAQPGQPPKEFTRGHLKRGVE